MGELRENHLIVFVYDKNDEPIPGAILQIMEDGEPVTHTEVRSYRDSPATFHLTPDIDRLTLRALVKGAESQEKTVAADAGVCTFHFLDIDITESSVQIAKDEKPFLDPDDAASLVELLARHAYAAPVGATSFFKDLVSDAKVPSKFKRNLTQWTGAADHDAKTLIAWAVGKGTNPLDPSCTTLGSLLQSLYEDLGLEDRQCLDELAKKYNLYPPNP